jgi:hypothetical protein
LTNCLLGIPQLSRINLPLLTNLQIYSEFRRNSELKNYGGHIFVRQLFSKQKVPALCCPANYRGATSEISCPLKMPITVKETTKSFG